MLLVLVFISVFSVGFWLNVKTPNQEFDTNKPLILTDYLNDERVTYARELSKVEPFAGNVESYAGYFRVSDDCERNMYFWYFPAENGNTSAPVLAWLQGGPGASSLFGLFEENGPYQIDSNSNLQLRTTSWTSEFSVIYIDNPVGTGLSFSDTECYLTNEDQVGRYLSIFMQQFFQLFPELRANPFYVTGESYGGKYVPAMVYAIHQMNTNSTTPVNLQGMAIGDGFSDPYNMMDLGSYLFYIGLIFESEIPRFDRIRDLIRQSIDNNEYKKAASYFNEMYGLYRKVTGLTNYYNFYIGVSAPVFYESFIRHNFKKIKAGNRTTYHEISYDVYHTLSRDMMRSVTPRIQKIINAGYKTLFFNG